MGPASENAGYIGTAKVHMLAIIECSTGNALSGPTSENVGYASDQRTPVILVDRGEGFAGGVASMGPASENAGYASMSFMVVLQRLRNAVARGWLLAASIRPKLTSGIFITPFLQMRSGLRERLVLKNRDNFKLSKNIALRTTDVEDSDSAPSKPLALGAKYPTKKPPLIILWRRTHPVRSGGRRRER